MISDTIQDFNTKLHGVTAYVVRLMCQAEQVLPGSFGRNRIQQMLGYLTKQTRDDTGHFKDGYPIYSSSNKDVGPSLTAYVLVTMQECQERAQDIQNSIQTSLTALERLSNSTLRANPLLLAISTYALALSNSKSKERFLSLLRDMKTDDGVRMYWSTSNMSNADSIETTSYALLSFLQFDDMKSSQKIVAWLVQRVRGSGYWETTKDSSVAFQAVAAFSARNYIPEVDLETTLESGDGTWRRVHNLSNQHTVLHTLISDFPVANGNQLKVTVKGYGTGILKIDLFYSRLAKEDETCPFEISPIQIKDVKTEVADNPKLRLLNPDKPCDVCGYCPDDSEAQHGRPVPKKCVQFFVRTRSPKDEARMSIVEVNLETGVTVEKSDLEMLRGNITFFPSYEVPKDGKGFIIFYLNKITSLPINFIFRLNDDFNGNETTRQGASIRVYDYYNPEKSCMKPYSVNPKKTNTVVMPCDGSDQCKCLRSECSQPIDDELFQMALALNKEKDVKKDVKKKPTLPKPVEKLKEYACDLEKANYVVNVTIVHVADDDPRGVKIANSTVNNVLLKGGNDIKDGGNMTFEWQRGCEHPVFEVGHFYYIIGKDLKWLEDGDHKRTRYNLMGTTLVINPRHKPLLAIVMNKFAQELKGEKGCTH